MSRIAKVLTGVGLAGALAMAAPVAANAATTTTTPFTWAACIASYAFFSDAPGSTNYIDYCGYGDLIEVTCKTPYGGDYWYGAELDEQYFRGYIDGVNLYVPDPSVVPAC